MMCDMTRRELLTGSTALLSLTAAEALADPAQPLPPLVHAIVGRRDEFSAAAANVARDLSFDRYRQRLLDIYHDLIATRRANIPEAPGITISAAAS